MSEHNFKALGKRVNAPSKELETFTKPESIAEITFTSDELTSLCPVTEQPDFSEMLLYYQPQNLCLESKSLKLYLWSFREEAIFAEGLADRMCRELFEACKPHYLSVEIKQNVRGGLQLNAKSEAGKKRVD